MDRLHLCYTTEGKPFDDGRNGSQRLYEIVRYRNTAALAAKADNVGKAKDAVQYFSTMDASFSFLSSDSVVDHDLEAPGAHPKDLEKLVKKDKFLALIVGYFIPGVSCTSATKGAHSKSEEIPISVSDAECEKVFYVVYKMGMGGKSLKGYTLVNPDDIGIFELAPIPEGMRLIFFKPQFLDMDEPAKKTRLRAVGNAISMITCPDEQKQQPKPRAQARAQARAQDHAELYEKIPEQDFTTKLRLAFLVAKI